MIFRRLSLHLREQNWTAIVIEFVLLVLGVFLGIQVANWNEDRLTREKSAEFTAELMADLQSESWRYQFLLEYHRDVRDAALAAADALSGKTPLSDEALLIHAYRATQYKQGVVRRSTYDELVSTGSIGLIADRSFRHMTVRTYSASSIDNLVKDGIESEFRRWFRMHIPMEVQGALAQRCGDRFQAPGDYHDFDKVIDYPCSTGLAASQLESSAEALRSGERALQLLRLRIADLDTRLYDMTDNQRDVYEFLLQIAKDATP